VRIAFIGGGVMAEAMIRGLLKKGIVKPGDVVASDVSAERRTLLKESYRVKTVAKNVSAIKGADVVVLAVKPVTLGHVLLEMRGKIQTEQLVVSIAAGRTMDTIASGLGHGAVVRSMPNMPAQIGEGITVWTTAGEVTTEQKEKARSILSSLGKEVFVAEEKYIDMATAVSGSGPAFVLMVVESLIDAGVHIGLSRELAGELVLQTVLGTALLAQKSEKHPAELRNMVTSPGGTTAEGLLQLEQGGLRAMFAEAVVAAYEKAKELGRGGA
jgi:pyrroline-5-carboxylate reductase